MTATRLTIFPAPIATISARITALPAPNTTPAARITTPDSRNATLPTRNANFDIPNTMLPVCITRMPVRMPALAEVVMRAAIRERQSPAFVAPTTVVSGFVRRGAGPAGLAALCRSIGVSRFPRRLGGAGLAVDRRLVAVPPLGAGEAPFPSEPWESAVVEAASGLLAERAAVAAVGEASRVEAGSCVARCVRGSWCTYCTRVRQEDPADAGVRPEDCP